jgi:hypothetical protein
MAAPALTPAPTTAISAATATPSSSKVTIDPTLIDSDGEANDIETKLHSKHTAAAKVAGRRRPSTADPKGKGKAHAVDAPSKALKRKAAQLKDRDAKKPRGGREKGTANYSEDDIDALHDILERILPIGGKAWGNVEEEFASWAELNGRPVRTAKSLEAKFKQVSDHLHRTLEGDTHHVLVS